jgi:asparagine synthase (glutamine-hydrolysing)
VWEKLKRKISPIVNIPPKRMTVLGKQIPTLTDKDFLPWLRGSILRRLGLRKKGEKSKTLKIATKDNMNPVDYWYETNPYICSFMQKYWKENKHLIVDKQLSDDMNHLFNDCVLVDKLQALSVLSTIKLINP